MAAEEGRELEQRQAEMSAEDNAREDAFDDDVQEGECHNCGHGESFHVGGIGECEAPGCDCDHYSGA